MKNNTWKTKIDPAFDELIKRYRHYLDICRLPRNSGYVALEEETFKTVKKVGFPSLAAVYDFIGSSPGSPSAIENLSEHNGIKYTAKLALMGVIDSVPELVEDLPPESKAYYEKKLNIGMSEEETKTLYAGKDTEERQEIFYDMVMDIQSLLFHADTMGYLDADNGLKGDKEEDIQKTLPVVLATVYDTIARLTHKKPMKKLLNEAQGGSDAALFKAMQIDKTILDLEWVRHRVREAMFSGDSKFFNKLGNAIKAVPIDHDMEYGELLLVLTFLWPFGLHRLDNKELINLLEAGGLKVQGDTETFRKFVTRLKLTGVLVDRT